MANSSSVKRLRTHILEKKRLGKPEFFKRLSDITDVTELKKNLTAILENKGLVYGIFEKKELVGVYIFKRNENYFVKKDSGVTLGGREYDLDEFWYGTSTAALQFQQSICPVLEKECMEKLEADIRTELSEQIIFGQIAGVEWNNELIYRKNLEGKAGSSIWGYLAGFAFGFIFGWIVFDNLALGLCFGPVYACLYGSIQLSTARGKSIETLDFVKKEEVEEDAIK